MGRVSKKQGARRPFRVLPITIVMAFMVLTLKIGDLVKDMAFITTNTAYAQEDPPKVALKPKGEHPAPAKPKPEDEVLEAVLQGTPASEVELIRLLHKKAESVEHTSKQVEKDKTVLSALQVKVKQDVEKIQAETKAQQDTHKQDEEASHALAGKAKDLVAMKPEKAAEVLATLSHEEVAMILDKIPAGKSRAPILAAMPTSHATAYLKKNLNCASSTTKAGKK